MWRKRTNWTLNWRGVLPFGSMKRPRKNSLMLLDTHYTEVISPSPSIIGTPRWSLGKGTINNPRKKRKIKNSRVIFFFFFYCQCLSFHSILSPEHFMADIAWVQHKILPPRRLSGRAMAWQLSQKLYKFSRVKVQVVSNNPWAMSDCWNDKWALQPACPRGSLGLVSHTLVLFFFLPSNIT